jgi:acetyl esterase/lipase
LVPVGQARSFVARLRELSHESVVYAELPYAQHAFEIFGSARAAHAAVAVEQFLAEIYTRRVVLGQTQTAPAASVGGP